jgi:hypothetical protein
MPSSKNLKNSYASYYPYPMNYGARFETADFKSEGVITEDEFFASLISSKYAVESLRDDDFLKSLRNHVLR